MSGTLSGVFARGDVRGEKAISPLDGGLKAVCLWGWFATRPSGTENIYKIYAESFKSEAHLARIVEEAQQIVTKSLGG